jgi:DNA-binding NarL/FixJ family response regulator
VMDKAPDTARKISVLLADDHTMFRQGLAGILASYGGVEVLGEVPNDSEALRLVGELEPDVVIMQVQMPFERAKESLERMRALPHPPKGHRGHHVRRAALRALSNGTGSERLPG